MEMTILEKRTIVAEELAPVLEAFTRELGIEKVRETLSEANINASRKFGCELADKIGSATIADLIRELKSWGTGGALEEEVLEQTENTFFFNVTRCRYAEAYEKLGVKDLGVALSCCRDFGFIQGFNPRIKLVRTKTIMEGADICDFRYYLE
jgi:hypothetical protein